MAFSGNLLPTELQLVIGTDNSQFETLISHLTSAVNDQRSDAETLFNLWKQHHPDALILKLSQLLHSSPHADARAMSAVLLRHILTAADESQSQTLYPSLSPTTQLTLKSTLLISVIRESSKSISKKLCHTISELASVVLPENGWPELLPIMFLCVTSVIPRHREIALLIFAQLAQYIGETLVPYLNTLHSVFLWCLGTWIDLDVRFAALSASINFIQCLEKASDRDKFLDLVPSMMQTLTEALNSGEESTAQDALKLLIELAGNEPRFLRNQISEIVGAMLQIAEAETLEEGTKHLAVEFVVTLAEAREKTPGMIRKLPQFLKRLFEILMKMLLDVEDDPEWHFAEIEDEDAGETSNYSAGQEYLDRLSISLCENTIIPVIYDILPAYLSAPEWQKHHAALIALAQIARGCSKVMINNLELVIYMILISFQDPHPRARWAAINAIAQLSTDLGPNLQIQYHHLVLPALASAMDDFHNPRVQAHAASAVLNFSENCTPELLYPYLDGFVGKLLVLLESGKQMVQSGALTGLASVADSCQKHFQKYYDAVMPYLKAVLVKATDKPNRMLRAKSMECISLVGMAVGNYKFKDDAKQVMDVLMSLRGSQIEADDPAIILLQAWARLCKCLGKDFLPYMNTVMPPLLHSAQLKPDVTITFADSDAGIDECDYESVLQEKAKACNMLCCYADELKEGFFPWIDQVAPTLVSLLKFYFHEEVRKAAVWAMPQLLRSAKLAAEKGRSQGRNESYVKQLSDYIITALVEVLHKEPETEICSDMLVAIKKCVQICGPVLDENQVRSIVEELKQVMSASSARRNERAEIEQEEQLFYEVGDCLETLLETFKAPFLPLFDELLAYLMLMLGKDRTTEEKRTTICIFDGVVEHCGDAALKYYDTFLPFMWEACNDTSTDVRQAAVYGVGICAEFGGSAFRPFVNEALSRLDAVIRKPDALHPDNVMAYDNAVSALGKICQFHRDCINAAQIVPAWLNCLPLKGDLLEARIVHDQLCSMVERSDEEVLGLNHQYLPKIVSIFAEVLSADKQLAYEQTVERMIILLRQLPASAMASTLSSLQRQQQLVLQSILSS